MGRGRGWTRTAVLLTLLVVVTGVGVSFAAGAVLRSRERDTADAALEGRARLAAAIVAARVGRYVDTTQTLAGALGAFGDLTAAKYARATEGLARVSLPGATSVTYVVPVANTQVGAVQAQWRAQGVTGLTLHPHGTGTHLFGVLLTPLDGRPASTRPSGADLVQAAAPVRALAGARRTGRVAVSDTYQLLIDQKLPPAQRQHSFVIVAPVYGRAGSGGTVFRGWVLMGLRGQNFLTDVIAQASEQQLDVTLFARNADQTQVVVASLRPAAASAPGGLRRAARITVADRTWLLQVQAPVRLLAGNARLLSAGATTGLLVLTALTAMLAATLASGHARARRQVQTATAELRAAEQGAREQAQLLGTILGTVAEGVTVIDDRGRPLLENPSARAILGLPDPHPDDPSGDHCDAAEPEREPLVTGPTRYTVFGPDGRTLLPVEQLPLRRALDGQTADDQELVIRSEGHPDGIVVAMTARPLPLADGRRGAVGVFRDVTAARAHEAELTGFAGVVAHDLKSPLATIAGYTELLEDFLRDHVEPPDLDEGLSAVLRVQYGAARMRRLIEDLLSYSTARDATLTPIPVDLRALVEQIALDHIEAARLSRTEDTLGPEISIGDLPPVQADPVLLRQVLDNLIGNAVKYTAPGERPAIEVTAHRAPGAGTMMVRVEVTDRGIGIPAGEHDKVFARFHRAHPAAGYTGTGLGLAICQRIVERHGGRIGVQDNPGGGSRFWFTVPAAPSLVAGTPPDPDGVPGRGADAR